MDADATMHARRFQRNDMRMLLRRHGETIVYQSITMRLTADTTQLTADSEQFTADQTVDWSAQRTIKALIERDVEIPGEVDQVAHAIVVRVLDDATDGIASEEIKDGIDTVELELRLGEGLTRRQITRRITAVAGVTRFLVR